MPDIRILVIDDDLASRRALGYILESDEWHVEMVALPEDALARLAEGGWNLVIANVSMSSLSGPLFNLLEDLAEAKGSLRVLFLVPAIAESRALAALEQSKLPYTTKPIHLHEFLEQVSDLLHESGAISEPLHRAHTGPVAPESRWRDSRKRKEGTPEMFASREEYYYYDEDELREFEEEERRKHGEKTGESDSG